MSIKSGVIFLCSAAAVFAVHTDAAACGGFFCQITPVNQSGEKILFAVDELGIEAHVQISYQGADADFAWILPTRQVPTLSVGTDAMFYFVDQATRPQFQLDWHQTGMCGFGPNDGLGGGTAGGPPSQNHTAGGVDVVSQGVVGPYDSVVLRADDGTALHDWLVTNNYRLTPQAETLLAPYLAEHDYFVALKLHGGSTVQDIQPIVLRFAGGEPCIPLRLTAVAALDDMQVTAFVLNQTRAVPTNYFEVTPDLARIDWLEGGKNYTDVVTAAANEAGGNAFVTEYAGPSNVLQNRLYTKAQYNLAKLRTLTDPATYVNELLSEGFPRTGQMQNELRKWIPEPQSLKDMNVTEREFYNCLSCYASALSGLAFDPVGMTNELDQAMLQPLAHAQALFDTFPYLTRLFTTISPVEMTVDPTFAFNTGLGDVSNLHRADLYLDCGIGGGYGRSPIHIVLPDGRVINLLPDGMGGYGRGHLDRLPGAESWRQLSSTGPGTLIGSNAGLINRELKGGSGGCSPLPGAASSSLLGCALFAGLFLLARRRARRSSPSAR